MTEFAPRQCRCLHLRFCGGGVPERNGLLPRVMEDYNCRLVYGLHVDSEHVQEEVNTSKNMLGCDETPKFFLFC